MSVGIPKELFNKVIALPVNLSDNAVTWPIHLYSTYFPALTRDLIENMTSDTSFKMSDLTALTTKPLQLDVLRTVQNQVTKFFKILSKQKDLMTKIFNNLQSNTRGRNLNFQAGGASSCNLAEYRSSFQYQQSESLAESTMSQYSHDRIPSQDRINSKVETQLCQRTGKQYPYDRDNNYVSIFPVGFRGWYKYGKTDHFSTRDCPLAQSGDFNKRKFVLEKWSYKPHTKKPESLCRQSGSLSRYGNEGQNNSNNGNFTNNLNENQISNSNHNMNTNNEGQNYNMNHNLNDNNSNQYNRMNNYNQNSNNTLNPNAIGNEGLSGQRVDHLNGTSNKSVKFKTEDLSVH